MRISDWSSDVCSSDLLTHPTLGAVEAWNDASHDATTSIVTYETHYRVVATGRHLAARSQIKFTPMDELEGLVAEAGLHVTRWLGDWQQTPWTPGAKEIIDRKSTRLNSSH